MKLTNNYARFIASVGVIFPHIFKVLITKLKKNCTIVSARRLVSAVNNLMSGTKRFYFNKFNKSSQIHRLLSRGYFLTQSIISHANR